MHDGRFIRYDQRFSRVLAMLTSPDVPVRSDGAIALCQNCQRWVQVKGGYALWLIKRLAGLGREMAKLQQWFVPRLSALRIGQEASTITRIPSAARRLAKQLADEREWTILLQSRGSEGVIVTRLPKSETPNA